MARKTKQSTYSQAQTGTKFNRRIKREQDLADAAEHHAPRLLSTNKKTGAAINLPLMCCRPSARCAETCYAMEGFVSAPNVIKATLRMNHTLTTGSGLDQLIRECRLVPFIRLNGIGDLNEAHIANVIILARKREIAEALNGKLKNLSIVLSWDVTHSTAHVEGYEGPLAFGPIQAGDEVPDDDRIIVVFPEHHQHGPADDITPHQKDCPLQTRNHEAKAGACEACGRCLRPHKALENFNQWKGEAE